MGAGTARGGACLFISGKVRKNMEFVVFAGVLLLLFIFWQAISPAASCMPM